MTLPSFANAMDAKFQFELSTQPEYALSISVSFTPHPSWVPDRPAMIVSNFDLEKSEKLARRINALLCMHTVQTTGMQPDPARHSAVLLYLLLDAEEGKLLQVSNPTVEADGRCHLMFEPTDGSLVHLTTEREELRLFAHRLLEWLEESS